MLGTKKRKKKINALRVTNKPLVSGPIHGWLLYLRGQRSIEGLLLLYKWTVFSLSWGRGQGLSTCSCTLSQMMKCAASERRLQRARRGNTNRQSACKCILDSCHQDTGGHSVTQTLVICAGFIQCLIYFST